jgi:hypothetical protein
MLSSCAVVDKLTNPHKSISVYRGTDIDDLLKDYELPKQDSLGVSTYIDFYKSGKDKISCEGKVTLAESKQVKFYIYLLNSRNKIVGAMETNWLPPENATGLTVFKLLDIDVQGVLVENVASYIARAYQ